MFEKEAEEYIKVNNLEWELECHRTSPIGEVKQAYQNGAEFGYNKAKEEMQEQIEKLKCCENCKHKNLDWGFSPICKAKDNIKIENPLICKCDKWEIKEND